jgi:hypothetical protein
MGLLCYNDQVHVYWKLKCSFVYIVGRAATDNLNEGHLSIMPAILTYVIPSTATIHMLHVNPNLAPS